MITARREERLTALADVLKQQHGTEGAVIVADLADPEAPTAIFAETQARGLQIDALVNNAGYGVPGYYTATTWQQQQQFIQVLVTAVAHLCHLYLPPMMEQNYGRIINVASVNGLLHCSPGQSLYASAKAFVINLSHTLEGEVTDYNIHVSALCPGFTYSEFHDVTGTRERVNQLPKSQWLDAETVVKLGYEAVMKRQPLCVTGTSSKLYAFLARMLPRRTVINLMTRQSRHFRKST